LGEWPRYWWCAHCWRALIVGAIIATVILGTLSMVIDLIRFGV
jgi:hypothetical protein